MRYVCKNCKRFVSANAEICKNCGTEYPAIPVNFSPTKNSDKQLIKCPYCSRIFKNDSISNCKNVVCPNCKKTCENPYYNSNSVPHKLIYVFVVLLLSFIGYFLGTKSVEDKEPTIQTYTSYRRSDKNEITNDLSLPRLQTAKNIEREEKTTTDRNDDSPIYSWSGSAYDGYRLRYSLYKDGNGYKLYELGINDGEERYLKCKKIKVNNPEDYFLWDPDKSQHYRGLFTLTSNMEVYYIPNFDTMMRPYLDALLVVFSPHDARIYYDYLSELDVSYYEPNALDGIGVPVWERWAKLY